MLLGEREARMSAVTKKVSIVDMKLRGDLEMIIVNFKSKGVHLDA